MLSRDVKNIVKIPWKRWGSRRTTIRWAEHFATCTLNFSKFFGINFPDQLVLAKNEIAQCYINKNQLNKILPQLLKKLYRISFEKLYENQAQNILPDFLSYCKKFNQKSLQNLSNSQLLKLFNNFLTKEDNFNNFLWIIFIIDDYFCKELEKKLKKYLEEREDEDKFKNFFDAILSPEKKSAIFQQTLDILKVAAAIKDKKISDNKAKIEIKNLVKKYAYFNIINFDEKPLTENYLKNEVNKIVKNKNINPGKEIKKINNQFVNSHRQFIKIKKYIKNDKKLLKLAEACHKITYYREYRNDIRRESYFYARQLYIEIANRLKLKLSDLLFLTREEIRQSLIEANLTVNYKKIQERKKYFGLLLLNKKLYFIFNKKDITSLLSIIEPEIMVKDFRGTIANQGKVIGKAKIIFSPSKDGHKLKKGDILVTSMTNLDFIPLMSKAAAIVTDEGGLLCHAAIISREMKKPCIVGTNIATKVLKDNDKILVNANHGVIKIIN